MPSTYATAFAAHHARGSMLRPRETTLRRGDTMVHRPTMLRARDTMVHRPTMLRARDTTTTTKSTQSDRAHNKGSRDPPFAPYHGGRGGVLVLASPKPRPRSERGLSLPLGTLRQGARVIEDSRRLRVV